jgi:hypothetical protein
MIFVFRLMCHSGKSLSPNRGVLGHTLTQKSDSSLANGSSDPGMYHGFASHSGMFFARQLRTRLCLPVRICAVLEVAARVSNFSATRGVAADLLVSISSLCSDSAAPMVSSGSKFIDSLRKNSFIIAREICLDNVSSLCTELVFNTEVTQLLFDKAITSAAVLIFLDKSDFDAVILQAIEQGIKSTSSFLLQRTKSDAYQSVLSDASHSMLEESSAVGEVSPQSIDMVTKQALMELRASISFCQMILDLIKKLPTVDALFEQFSQQALDNSWYSSIALDLAAKDAILQAQRILHSARMPKKLIENLVKLLVHRLKKMTLISFDNCTNEVWNFVSLFFSLRDHLKTLSGFDVSCFQEILEIFADITCGPSQTSWLSRYAVIQEQKLEEAIVADELLSLVEASYSGSRVYLWLSDLIATAAIINNSQTSVASSEFESLMIVSHQKYWELLLVFVEKALIEILKLCAKESQTSSSDQLSSTSFGLSSVVKGIGGGLNAAIQYFDPTL